MYIFFSFKHNKQKMEPTRPNPVSNRKSCAHLNLAVGEAKCFDGVQTCRRHWIEDYLGISGAFAAIAPINSAAFNV
jgi:hypothetical protein